MQPPADDDDRRKRKQVRWLADAYAAGIAFPAGAGAGLLMGWWLDKLFGTKYWLTSIFAALGVIAAFINLFRLGMRDDGTGQ